MFLLNQTKKANTGFDMESAHPKCQTCTRTWNILMYSVKMFLYTAATTDDFQPN